MLCKQWPVTGKLKFCLLDLFRIFTLEYFWPVAGWICGCRTYGYGDLTMYSNSQLLWFHGNPLQYSCLENPMDRGIRWAKVHGVAKSDMTEELSMGAHDVNHDGHENQTCLETTSENRYNLKIDNTKNMMEYEARESHSHCWWDYLIFITLEACLVALVERMFTSSDLSLHLRKWVKYFHQKDIKKSFEKFYS